MSSHHVGIIPSFSTRVPSFFPHLLRPITVVQITVYGKWNYSYWHVLSNILTGSAPICKNTLCIYEHPALHGIWNSIAGVYRVSQGLNYLTFTKISNMFVFIHIHIYIYIYIYIWYPPKPRFYYFTMIFTIVYDIVECMVINCSKLRYKYNNE